MVVNWTPVISIAVAALLSLIIGLEREFFAKAAGMRTYALVGTGSALFTVVGMYGFVGVSSFDGSRVAAQIVSGVGFLGAGLIFVRRNSVQGLTTAAGVWFVAGVGMAAGARLYVLAALATILYLVVMVGSRPLRVRLPHAKSTILRLNIDYLDGHGVLRGVMESLSSLGVKVLDLEVLGSHRRGDVQMQSVHLEVEGTHEALSDVAEELGRVVGVSDVSISSQNGV